MEPGRSTSLQELVERIRVAGSAEVVQEEALAEILELLGQCARSLKDSQESMKAQLTDLDHLTAERDTLMQRVAEMTAEVAELDSLRARLVELEQAAAERDVLTLKVESLQPVADEAESLKQRITELESTLQATVAERDSLAARVLELEPLAAETSALRDRIAELEPPAARVSELEAELERLRVEALQVESLEKSLEELRARAADAEQARTAAQTAMEQTRKMEESLNKVELERKILLDQLNNLNRQMDQSDELSRRVSELEGILEREREEKAQLQAQLAAMRSRVEAESPAVEVPGPRPVISVRTSPDSGFTREPPEIPPAPRSMPRSVPSQQPAVRPARSRSRGKRQFGELLIEAGIITQEQLDEAMRVQAADPRKRLGSIIVDLGFATEEVIAATLAAQLRLRFVEKLEREMRSDAMRMVPPTLVLNHRVVPLFFESMTLTVAMANPMDLIALENLEHATGVRIQPVVATAAAIEDIINRYYSRTQA